MCEEKEQLVAYLYDDLANGERARFESHLRTCVACRDELKALRGVRADLAAWAPPEPDFGFRVVRGGRDAAERDVVRPPVAALSPSHSWRAWWTPAAGLAAAAVLVLAAAASLAHVEVHRGPDGITVRTGWSSSGGNLGQTNVNSQVAGLSGPHADVRLASASPVDAAYVEGLERRLSALEAATSRDSGVRSASYQSARNADAELVARVRELLAQSETKQQGELALRIAQVTREFEAQRTADLSRIQRGLGQIGQSVADEAASHRDLTTYILASAKQK
jgi:Putative zinc-finger